LPVIDIKLVWCTGFWNPNWFNNMIGVQLDLGPLCLLLRSASSSVFTSEHKAHCSKILRRANWTGFTGANTLWLAQSIVYDGLLTGNDTEVASAYAASNGELYYSSGSSVRVPSVMSCGPCDRAIVLQS
jgi:hypothetical protein